MRGQGGQIPSVDNFGSPANQAFYKSGVHRQLDNSQREIQLLAIDLDNKGKETLEVRLLYKFPLQIVRNNYCAISCVAGKHTITEAILVNGIPFNAFKGLARALRAIRGDPNSHDLSPTNTEPSSFGPIRFASTKEIRTSVHIKLHTNIRVR